MSHHNTEAVTGLLDGQLKGVRLWLVKRHVSTCPVCAAEYRHQQHVRRMLQANPPVAAMSDPPEFFWSKVKAEIQRRGGERVEAPMPKLAWSVWLAQHPLVITTAVLVLVAAFGMLVQTFRRTPSVRFSVSKHPSFAEVEELKTAIPNTAATMFDSEDAGVTVIWVSGLPWTRDMNEMKTEFANLDT